MMKWVLLGVGLSLGACSDESDEGAGARDAGAEPSEKDGGDDGTSDDENGPETDDPATDTSDQQVTDVGSQTDDDEPAEETVTDDPQLDDADVELPDGGAGATDDGAGGDDASPERDSGSNAAVEPVTLDNFCESLRTAWFETCEAAQRDDCEMVDAHLGALACAESPAAIEQGKIVFDGSAAAECLADGELDVVRAWEQAYLVGSDACFEVFFPNAQVGDACAIEYGFTAACVQPLPLLRCVPRTVRRVRRGGRVVLRRVLWLGGAVLQR